MVSNSHDFDFLNGIEPYPEGSPELERFDGADFSRMLATIKKELEEGKYD